MRPTPHRLVAVGLVLTGAVLRVVPLSQNRFHPDEGLYATFARLIASGRDPLLSTVVVDKPPLPFYLMAASMSVFGGNEFAARLPSLFAGILTISLVYQIARALYGKTTACLAGLIFAGSPIAILFAITLFTDTLLAAGLYFSLLLAIRRNWAGAGWAFGLAFACKQTALFFLPFIVIVPVLSFLRASAGKPKVCPSPLLSTCVAGLKSFAGPAVLCAAAIFLWDFVRHAPISFWAQGYVDNNPGRLVRSNEIWPRLWAWVELGQYFTGSPIINTVLILGLPGLLLFNRRSLPAIYDFILTGFAVSFLTVYWLFAFNVWDRYLLILTPIVALLAGRLLERTAEVATSAVGVVQRTIRAIDAEANRRVVFRLTGLLLALSLLPPSLTAARSGFPIGGDHGAYDGIDEIAKTLNAVPPGSVLYDHWLSWMLGFYLFDGPAYLVWMPGPGALADDLRAFGRQSPRYIVAPTWESFAEMQAAIEEAGFTVEVVQQTYRRDGSLSFTLYQIKPRSQ